MFSIACMAPATRAGFSWLMRLASARPWWPKVAVTADRSGMLREVPDALHLEPGDVQAYVGLQKIARCLEHRDTVEYWKSAPYLLNFMEHDQLKEEFCERAADPRMGEAVCDAARNCGTLLPWETLRQYRELDPQNPRLRELLRTTVDAGAWQLLWIPPALPYYGLPPPFAKLAAASFTKRLVFSSWHVVPKAVPTPAAGAAIARPPAGGFTRSRRATGHRRPGRDPPRRSRPDTCQALHQAVRGAGLFGLRC